ncbi:MAG: extracellular solute-binding protein [Deinococcales bacterium]
MKKALILLAALLLVSVQAQTIVRFMSLTGDDGRPEYEDEVIAAFNASHPDIQVVAERLPNEDFKKKLPTLLQTNEAPHLFYSWGGGILEEQVAAGTTRDISGLLDDEFLSTMSAAGMNAFTINGEVVGLPWVVSEVGFWYNKDLAAQAEIDVSAIQTWSDFLAAVQKAKDAGLTPIAAGGLDKWPLHFYWSYLAMREAGHQGFIDAQSGEGDGFAAEAFVKAGEDFKELIDMQPFQEGFMTMGYGDASGFFGDGGAVFHLMGNWEYGSQKGASQNGGLSDEQLGLLSFPMVEGGAGDITDTFGGINGFVVAKDAPDEAVTFLKYLMSVENQTEAGARALFIPMAKGSEVEMTNPFFAQISRDLAASNWHQIFLDQSLGADVGGVVNDISAQLATGDITPADAAALIQESWELR